MAKQCQLRLDSGRSPRDVVSRHASDQLDDLGIDLRAAWRSLSDLPTPEVPPALVVPPDHGVGFHDGQCVAPAREQAAHENPEDSVAVVDLRALHAALEHGELLAEGGVLQGEPRSISEQVVDEREE